MRILIMFALLLAGVPARAQIHVSYGGPPAASETELFSKVVVVLRGRVEARRMETGQGPTTSVYTMRVLELLKDDGRHSVGGSIDVHRHGGFDSKNVDIDFPPFGINDEVVVFLERGANEWYWPLHGPHGAFRLTSGGRTHAYGKIGEVSKRYHGRPVGEFLAELRKHESRH